MNSNAKVYVAGHQGLVGSALVRRLGAAGFTTILTRTVAELDLRNQQAVNNFFAQERPDYVFLAAAKVGGIKANMDRPAEFIYDNLAIELNVIHASYVYGVKKLLFLGSSCIYPRNASQPIKEEYLLSGELEKTNDAYAVAKIAGIMMCQTYNKQYGTNFIACMPTNLYGPHDNFDLESSHVLPALLAKFYQAKKSNALEVVIWGSGKPYREFLYVDDLADACLFLMQQYSGNEIINIGTGQDTTIAELAATIKNTVGYQGSLVYDATKPDGTPRKLLNVERMNTLGWRATTSLQNGIEKTLQWCNDQKIFE
ncbi:MAG: GDP-L-fucose synthase [Candidatus Dependentiae bacterium]|nr:GDP-L-fucose synthase [Candidatus Dependentiae bacterium]